MTHNVTLHQAFSITLGIILLLDGITHADETPPMGIGLEDKAAVFQADMIDRFIDSGQLSPKLRLPSAEYPYITYNMPDNAYMTGMYLAMQAMRWAVTGEAEAKEQASASILALEHLTKVSGVDGLLARATVLNGSQWYDDGTWRLSDDEVYWWRGDVSSDQVDGVMFGYYLAYKLVASTEEKAIIAENAAALIDHIIDNDYRIVGYDGEPTSWGRYYPEYVNTYENMNALLMLQHLKVAHYVTGEQLFEDAYWDRINNENYDDIALTARVMVDPLDANHSDDVLQFLAYLPLLSLETDPTLHAKYVASLQRSWEGAGGYPGTDPEANPLYNFLAHAFLNDDSKDAEAIITLDRFPLDMKLNSDTVGFFETEFSFTFDPTPISAAPAENDPVPIDRSPKTWSAWVDNPYQAGTRTDDIDREYTGHDYLLGYWLGRYYGYAGDNPTSHIKVYVDFSSSDTETGSEATPYNTLTEALAVTASGGTVFISGNTSTSEVFSGSTIIDQTVTIEVNPEGSGSVQIGL